MLALNDYWLLSPQAGADGRWDTLLAKSLAFLPEAADALAPLSLPDHFQLTVLPGDVPSPDLLTQTPAPAPRRPGKADTSGTRLLRLLNLLTQDADTHEIEKVIAVDPGLTVSLLRLVNSVSVGLPRKVSSYSQAIVILGRRQLSRWLSLLMFAQGGKGQSQLLPLAARRGRLMERLAQQSFPDSPAQADRAFMTGVLSLADRAVGLPLPELVGQLAIDDNISTALLNHEDQLGRWLQLADALDRGLSDGVRQGFAELGISPLAAVELQVETILWADGATRES